MNNIQDLRLSRDLKYTALYTALGYFETKRDIYEKEYMDTKGRINILFQNAVILGITYLERYEEFESLPLSCHKDFVVFECVDKLLSMGYKPQEIIVDENNEYDIYCKNLYIRCFEWGTMPKEDDIKPKNDTFYSINYESRLISGVIERNTKIVDYTGNQYDYGIFENDYRLDSYNLYNKDNILCDKEFIVEGDKLLSYKGKESHVVIPEGIKELESCCFWDNQNIEEVILPESLINLGGDTFYNCKNLKKIKITKNVSKMGNNPFAGCPLLELENESDYFYYNDGALFTSDMNKMIYYSIKHTAKEYIIPENVQMICKHTFYLCDNLESVILPKSLKKMENNPFSGCTKLHIKNNSYAYKIIEDVIYDKYLTSVCGCLTSINTDCLVLLPVQRINRNSFWNCKGIKKIIFPDTLDTIGYNPFVGCSNIEFESQSEHFKVVDGVLYNKDMSKLICCPSRLAVGDVHIPDSVTKLERGAFSGCDKMTSINFHNVTIVSKSCFTNCNSLTDVYCSDLITYIGEWAFGHCHNLKTLNVYKDCVIDNNALSSTSAKVIRRDNRTNYVIESDNIYTLTSMLDSLKGKIDSILIDPPYNSNIDGIGYKDRYSLKDYYNFMYTRLSLAKELLSDNGCLVINIDGGGLKFILSIAKRIFVDTNVTVSKWKKLHPKFDMNRDVNPNKKKITYEYIILCKKNNNTKLNKIMQPYFDGDDLKEKESYWPEEWDCFGTTSSAKDEIAKLFGDRKAFPTPKPVKLIKEFARATTNKDSIVLDFFAGSGTVGQAVVELNKEDNGNRKVILVSNNESNICKEITLKRVNMIDDSFVFID